MAASASASTADFSDLLSSIGANSPSAVTPEPWDPDVTGWVIGIFGKEGAGKNHFTLTAPPPWVFFDTEGNTEETLRSFPGSEKMAKIFRYKVPILGEKDLAKAEFDKFYKDYHGTLRTLAMKQAKATLIIDGVTKLWEMIRYALVPLDAEGRVKSAWNYAAANNAYQALFSEARAHHQRLIFTARAQPVWEEVVNEYGKKQPKKTSRFDADWKDETPYMASVIIEVVANNVPGAGGKLETQRTYRLTKSQPQERLKNTVFTSLDYPSLVEYCKMPNETLDTVLAALA